MEREPRSGAAFEARRLSVRGTTLVVREATADDADALVLLYDGLGIGDLQRRFFTGFHPRRAFVEGWLSVRDRGGVVLVAVEQLSGGGERIVADAGYAPVADDVAELAITVDPDWRGWLGPYLLDALIDDAREHGFHDLVAEVLTGNCAMLAMLRARGCAFEPDDDLTTVRALVGTDGAAPHWPADTPHPRVLVEGASASWSGAEAASRAGMGVLVCPGPERGRMHPCPLLSGDHCPLVDGADAVLVALPTTAATTAPLLAAHGTGDPDQPLGTTVHVRATQAAPPSRRRTFVIDTDESGPEIAARLRAAVEDDQVPPDDET